MQSQTKTALAEEVLELVRPLKRVLCWIVGHNWLSSRYNPLLGIGGDWQCRRCGKFAFSLKR